DLTLPLALPPRYLNDATPSSPLSTSASRLNQLMSVKRVVPSRLTSWPLPPVAALTVRSFLSVSMLSSRSRSSGISVTTPALKLMDVSSRMTNASGPTGWLPFLPFSLSLGGSSLSLASQASRRVPLSHFQSVTLCCLPLTSVRVSAPPAGFLSSFFSSSARRDKESSRA